MKITLADTPTIRMDCHPIKTNWYPHLCHPHHFYTGCPSWHNPPNLSLLGTGTKYAGLHTQWLGSMFTVNNIKSQSALTLLFGRQEGNPASKKTEWWGVGMVICLERGVDLHIAQPMPLPLTIFCSSKSRLVLPEWFCFSGAGLPGLSWKKGR